MSFRELKTFTETVRMLGYSRLISVESFRTPNVELVADVLYWLLRRYEPSADVPYVIDTEGDRIMFFRRICELVLAKSRVRLNIKKLYQADGYAVQELLKLANILKEALKARLEEDTDYASLQSQAAQRGHQDAKRVRQLCADITNQGSNLFFLVEQETKNRGNRSRILSRATEVGEFERRLRELLTKVASQVEELQQSLRNLQADETNLEHKIEGKRTQLERAQKRLKSLMNVHPAFMEEYERYEADLHTQFVVYLEQYRNLEYLEHELAKFNKMEDELLLEQETKLRLMRERLRKEELKVLRGEGITDDAEEDDDESAAVAAARKAASFNQTRGDNNSRGDKRPRVASGRQRPKPGDGAASASGNGGGAAAPGGKGPARGLEDSDAGSDDDDDSDASDTSDDEEELGRGAQRGRGAAPASVGRGGANGTGGSGTGLGGGAGGSYSGANTKAPAPSQGKGMQQLSDESDDDDTDDDDDDDDSEDDDDTNESDD